MLALCTPLGGCTTDAVDHDGRCAPKVLAGTFTGLDLELLQGYTRVGGDLQIPEGTTTLAALGCLEHVDGGLTIAGLPALADLTGLENLQHVGGLGLSDLPALDDTSALSGLRDIDGGMSLWGLPALRELAAPANLTTLTDVELVRLSALERWEAPIGVDELDRVMIAEVEPSASITALAGVTHIGQLNLDLGPQPNPLPGSPHLHLDGLRTADALALHGVPVDVIASLGALESVGGMTLSSPSATDLAGLASLRTATSLRITGSPALTSLHGLEALEEASSIELTSLAALADLDGLAGLRRVVGQTPAHDGVAGDLPSIQLERCPALHDVSGLDGLESDYLFELSLRELPSLTTLPSWPALRRIGYLDLDRTGVTDLDALLGVTRMDASYFAAGDPAPHDSDNFSITLTNNPALADLEGLAGVVEVGAWGDLYIHDNAALPSCSVDALVEQLGAAGRTDGTYEVGDNGGC